MVDTPNTALPLLAAAQAQKHVTVNEALTRLDALTQASVASASLAAPPVGAEAGDRYIVAAGASDAWAGREGEIAFFADGGWAFATPGAGWRVWVDDESAERVFVGGAWRPSGVSVGTTGAGLSARTLETEETVQAGAGFDATLLIPDRAVVIGATGRVSEAVTGAGLTSWRLGVAGAEDRYGTSIGLALNSTVIGISGAPVGYYGATPLRITAEGGTFTGGKIRLALHYFEISAPAPV
ncbi:MAG: DUF2793 domain-containing protein [Pseudomonadota bacterium]